MALPNRLLSFEEWLGVQGQQAQGGQEQPSGGAPVTGVVNRLREQFGTPLGRGLVAASFEGANLGRGAPGIGQAIGGSIGGLAGASLGEAVVNRRQERSGKTPEDIGGAIGGGLGGLKGAAVGVNLLPVAVASGAGGGAGAAALGALGSFAGPVGAALGFAAGSIIGKGVGKAFGGDKEEEAKKKAKKQAAWNDLMGNLDNLSRFYSNRDVQRTSGGRPL